MSFTRGKRRSTSRNKKSGGIEFVPKSYQEICIRLGLKRPAFGFLLAPGLGKTAIILFIFKLLKKLGIVDHLFVLAKKNIVYHVWQQEIKKWSGTRALTSVVVHGGKKKAALEKDVDVYLMNYEGLNWLKKQKWFFRKAGKLMLACDESSKLRNTNTVRFRRLKSMLKFFTRRYIMTGSPRPKSLMNLFGQVYVLDHGKALGQYITQFRNNYMQPAGFMGREWVVAPGAEKRIFKQVRKLVIRFGDDQLDMPPLNIGGQFDRFCYLPKKHRALYNEMEEEMLVELGGDEITAANAAVASQKCRQIANGGLKFENKKGYKWIHDVKCENLVDLLEELEGEPALVGYEFHHDKYRLQSYLAKHAPQFAACPFVDGKTKDAVVHKAIRDYQKGRLPALFGNTSLLAHGLNLQDAGGIVIFFSMTWNLEDYEQFIRRVWRQGQTRRVIVYRLLMKDTVDERMVNVVRGNDKEQRRFLKAMEKHYGFR
jgi:SNF2 family DNA or RNA helicase